jgi:hypothetical protein
LPWHDVPCWIAPATTRTAASSRAPWKVVQVTRKTRGLGTRRWRTATVYALTSLTFAQAGPARPADLLRGHWAIEVCQAGCAYGM